MTVAGLVGRLQMRSGDDKNIAFLEFNQEPSHL